MESKSTTENSLALLDTALVIKSKRKRCTKRRVCFAITATVTAILLLGFIISLCFMIKSSRCFFSRVFSLDLAVCDTPEVLQSLSNVDLAALNQSYAEQINQCQGQTANDTHNTDCATVLQLTKQDLEYIALAEQSWEISWEIHHNTHDWRLEQGSSLKSGRVYSKPFVGIGRVFKVEAYIDLSPKDTFDLLITNTNDLPSWNPKVDECQIVDSVTENIDIIYVTTMPIGGGLISPRYYVNLRHWKQRNNVTLSAEASTTHPDTPDYGKRVRLIHKTSAVLFKPVAGQPNKCLFEHTSSVDVQGWIPQWMVDRTLAKSLMEFLDDIRAKIKQMKDGQK